MASRILNGLADTSNPQSSPVGTSSHLPPNRPPSGALEFITSPLLKDALTMFLQHRQQAGLSDATIALYTRQCRAWATWRSAAGVGPRLADVTIEELRAYLAYLQTEHVPHRGNPYREALAQERLAPATIQSVWRTLHAAWVFWINEGLLSDKQATFFVRGRLPKPKAPQQIRPTYDQVVIEALLAADGPASYREGNARDKAIILLLCDTGMRVSELCGVGDEHINLEERQAIVTGKGNKQRYVFWTERAARALDAYLAVRSGEASGALFRSVGAGGVARKGRGGGLGATVVRDILKRRAKRAGQRLPASKVHALRHTFAHRFLDNGGDGLHLQQLLGHESMTTTARYVRENPTGLRRVYRRTMGGA
jgi:site-specific recombinase XerD